MNLMCARIMCILLQPPLLYPLLFNISICEYLVCVCASAVCSARILIELCASFRRDYSFDYSMGIARRILIRHAVPPPLRVYHPQSSGDLQI